jgi:hypothetical protein
MTADRDEAHSGDRTHAEVRATDLMVVLHRDSQGPELAQEPIADSDVADIFAELWRDGWLRAGRPDVPYDALSFRITAQLANGAGSKCEKLLFGASDPQGQTCCMEPGTHAFQDVATRASQVLLLAEILKPADVYVYEVALRSQPRQPQTGDQLQFTVRPKITPLAYLTVPLKLLRERAESVGTVDDGAFPVFYTVDALRKAQRYAQKGADHEPPTETGGVLVGPLCSCPKTGEFFVVICDVLEARDAEGSSLSLTYTGKTWSRIQRVVRAKQLQPATRAYRIVGQAHGHNVLPGGSCQECEKAAKCKLTSVFVSHDDRTWSQAVFSKQPWQVCHIFGLNARGEPVQALFTLRENRLQKRGFYVIANFEPDRGQQRKARSD